MAAHADGTRLTPARIPPIQCLVSFEALARLRSVSKAAEELCVTASAVSHRIRQLEDQLGFKLFGRDFALTTEGAAALEQVRSGLAPLQRLGERQRSPRARLRVAAPPTFCRQLLMPRLRLFHLAYPEVDLALHVTIPLADLTAEPCDLQVRYGAGGYADGEHRLLQRDELVPACSPGTLHESGPFDGLRTRQELRQARLIRCPLEPWATWFQHCGLDLPEPQGSQFNDIGLAYDAAASDLGVMLVRRKLGAAWFESGRLVPLAQEAVPSPFAYHLCHEAGALERWECAAFADWLTQLLA